MPRLSVRLILKTCAGWMLILLLAAPARTQTPECMAEIDQRAIATDDSDLHVLARRLTDAYSTDFEKTRSIFRWITAHIDYDLAELKHKTHDYDQLRNRDRGTDQASGDSLYNEQVAEMVFRKRLGICDGYARLFGVMCGEAGIETKMISGYGRHFYKDPQHWFDNNHSWNAVRLDCQWYLLDATWASGYTDMNRLTYTRFFSENYYLTSPGKFSMDHYPADTSWLLCAAIPDRADFLQSPNRAPEFREHGIRAYQPGYGLIHYGQERILHFELTAPRKLQYAGITSDKNGTVYIRLDDLDKTSSLPGQHRTSSLVRPEQAAGQMDVAGADACKVVSAIDVSVFSERLKPPYVIRDRSVTVDYPLPKGNFHTCFVYHNGEAILRYALRP